MPPYYGDRQDASFLARTRDRNAISRVRQTSTKGFVTRKCRVFSELLRELLSFLGCSPSHNAVDCPTP